MRNLSGLPLDDDILDRILMFSPTFEALYAAILTCKAFHAVYNAYPQSIIRNVAYNVAGPAAPQAVRLVRYEMAHPYNPDDWEPDSDPDSSGAGEETTEISPLTTDEIYSLKQVASVAKRLEDIFSFRHKDRNSTHSVLSSSESWRFRRAIYRIMLYSRLFPGHKILDPELWSDHDDDDDDDEADNYASRALKERTSRKEFLEGFVTQELYEINSVVRFLEEIADWIQGDDAGTATGGFAQTAISAGPAEILEAYEAESPDPIEEYLRCLGDLHTEHELLVDYITNPLAKLWEDRKAKKPPSDATLWKSILDNVIGENDICKLCGKTEGLNLWGEGNWRHMFRLSPLSQYLPNLLTGNLKHNPRVVTQLSNFTCSTPETFSDRMKEIHEIKTTASEAWEIDDPLCSSCNLNIVTSHLNLWLLESQRKAGEDVLRDCWYGYNCRTMSHKPDHAKNLNHLCDPTR